ncbi:hypothetical protein Tco_0210664 [Tanacetum coccineum]
MADNRTMAQMLQAPIEGYEDAIVVPPINANNFELKQPLINLVQSNKFTGRQDPHNHLRFFNKVTSTFRHPEVPNTSIKLLLFPFSLDGEARDWLDKEPPRSILTWDDLVSKFINIFFPPSLRKPEFISPKQNHHFIPDTTTTPFNEAWDRLKGLLRKTAPPMAFGNYNQLDDFFTIHLKACSFLLCAYLDFEPFVIVFMSLLSCDLVSLTTLLILWLYLESFKSEFAEVFVFKILKLSLDNVTSLIHIESRKSPTAVLFDDDTGRISISHSSALKWNVFLTTILIDLLALDSLSAFWVLVLGGLEHIAPIQ